MIVVSRFNEGVTQKLVDGATDCCLKHGAKLDDIDVLWVPGAWELPLAVAKALQTERYDCAVAVGAVVRGEQPATAALVGVMQGAAGHRLHHLGEQDVGVAREEVAEAGRPGLGGLEVAGEDRERLARRLRRPVRSLPQRGHQRVDVTRVRVQRDHRHPRAASKSTVRDGRRQ